jgi:hypothetical protein
VAAEFRRRKRAAVVRPSFCSWAVVLGRGGLQGGGWRGCRGRAGPRRAGGQDVYAQNGGSLLEVLCRAAHRGASGAGG